MTLIICLVWLTVVAGRSNRDEELHLNWFDAWKTELAAAVIIVLWLIPMLVSGSVISVTDILLGVNDELATMYGYYNYVMNSIPYIVVGGILDGVYQCHVTRRIFESCKTLEGRNDVGKQCAQRSL